MSSGGSSRKWTLRRAWRESGSKWSALAVAVLGIVAVALAVYSTRTPPAPPNAGAPVLQPLDTPKPTPAPALSLPAHPRVVIVGDSWSAGVAATPGKGYALVASRTLGWDTRVVPGGSGTGFMNAGPDNTGTYLQRLANEPDSRDVDLVVIQGGLNDAYADDEDLTRLNDAAELTIAEARTKYPSAQILVMGPLAPVASVRDELFEVNTRLQEVTTRERVNYISPTNEAWFGTDELLAKYVDAAAANHPNTAGHAYLARRFVADVRKISS